MEAQGVSACRTEETTQTHVIIFSPSFLLDTVTLNQAAPKSYYPYTNRHYRVRLYTFVGQPLSKWLCTTQMNSTFRAR